jgi:antitoxin CptB
VELTDRQFDRLRWRCRRGLLELDVILGNFLDQHYAWLGESERRDFERLLETSDNDLLAILNSDQQPADPTLIPIVRVIRQSSGA